jgi:hypothetical protein
LLVESVEHLDQAITLDDLTPLSGATMQLPHCLADLVGLESVLNQLLDVRVEALRIVMRGEVPVELSRPLKMF